MLALPDENCVLLTRWPTMDGAGAPVRVPLEAAASPPLFLEWGPPGSSLLAVGGPSLLQIFQVISDHTTGTSSPNVARSVLAVASAPLANRPTGLAWHPKVAVLAVFDNMGAQVFSLRSPSRLGAVPCGRVAFGVPRANKCGVFVSTTEGGSAVGDRAGGSSCEEVNYIALAMAGSSELNVWRLSSDGSDFDEQENAERTILSDQEPHRCFAVDGLMSRKRHIEDGTEAEVQKTIRGQFRSLLPVQLPAKSHQASVGTQSEECAAKAVRPVCVVGGLDGEAMVQAISDGLGSLLGDIGSQETLRRHGSHAEHSGALMLPSKSAVNDFGGGIGGGFRRTLPGEPSRKKGPRGRHPTSASTSVNAVDIGRTADASFATEVCSHSFAKGKAAAAAATTIEGLIAEASSNKTMIDLRGRIGASGSQSGLARESLASSEPPDAAATLFDLRLLERSAPSKVEAAMNASKGGNEGGGSSSNNNTSSGAAACIALFALTAVSSRSPGSDQRQNISKTGRNGHDAASGDGSRSSEALRAVCAAALPKPMQAPDLLAVKSPNITSKIADGQEHSSASTPGLVAVGCLSSRTVALFELTEGVEGSRPQLTLLDTAQIPAPFRPRGLAFEALPDNSGAQLAPANSLANGKSTYLTVLCAARSVDCSDQGPAGAGDKTSTLAKSISKAKKAREPLPTSLTKSPTQPHNAHVLYFRCPVSSLPPKAATSAVSQTEACNEDTGSTKATVAVPSAVEGGKAMRTTAGGSTVQRSGAASETAARAQARTQIRAQFEALMLGDEALRESDDVDATQDSDNRSFNIFGFDTDFAQAQISSNNTAAMELSTKETTEHLNQSSHGLARKPLGFITPANGQSSVRSTGVDDRGSVSDGLNHADVSSASSTKNGRGSSSGGGSSGTNLSSRANAEPCTNSLPAVEIGNGSINAEGMVALAMALGQLEARLISKLDSALQLAREHSERLARLEFAILPQQHSKQPSPPSTAASSQRPDEAFSMSFAPSIP